MKQKETVMEYLQERKEMAYHNLLCYSKSYAMDTPKDGMEEAFAEAKRDVEIVVEILTLVKMSSTTKRPRLACEGYWKKVHREMEEEIDNDIISGLASLSDTTQKITRRGVRIKDSWIATPEILNCIGAVVRIINGSVILNGKVLFFFG